VSLATSDAEALPHRHRRKGEQGAADGRPRSGRRIGTKLGIVAGSALLVMVLGSGILVAQLNAVSSRYDKLLGTEVDEALLARQMQVEFKKQVQEWKDILLRGFNPTDLATYTGKFRNQDAKVEQLAGTLIQRASDDELRSGYVQFREAHQLLDAGYQNAYAGFVRGGGRDFHTADTLVRGKDRPPTALIDDLVGKLQMRIADRVASQRSSTALRERVVLAGGLLLLLVISAAAFLVARSVIRPVRLLTRSAYGAANETLPAAIAAIRSSPADADPPALAPVEIRTRDELAELGRAFTSMQATAVALAVAQHRAERDAAEMLINLGRRNQNLLNRTLSYISELERDERNPDALARLFRLDHATTRIRRQAESMLVLAGATQTRTTARSAPVGDVVRAALSEIEEYARVDLHHVEDASITGAAAPEVTHLLAELIENATHFSPPSTRVTVVGQMMPAGYRIRVIDEGIGMTGRELAETNDRLAGPQQFSADTKLLGLHVAGLLAARRDIRVDLEPSAGRGITANVLLPAELLTAAAARRDREPDRYDWMTRPGRQPERKPASAGAAEPAPVAASAVASSRSEPPEADRDRPVNRAAASPGAARPQAVPRRVRGAQLPEAAVVPGGRSMMDSPDVSEVRGQLSALQHGVRAGRSAALAEAPGAGSAGDEQPAPSQQGAGGTPAGNGDWNLGGFLAEVAEARRRIEMLAGGVDRDRPEERP
jgi:hypothetical protein